MIDLIRRNILIVILLLPLLINIIILLKIDGPRWGFYCITLWIFTSILISYAIYRLLKNWALKKKKTGKIKGKISYEKILRRLRCIFIIFTVMLIFTFTFSLFMGFMTHLKAEANRPTLQQLVSDLIKDAETDEEKTQALLEWFDEKAGNIYDDYDLWRQGKRIFSFLPWRLKIFSSEPYIGFRTFNDRDSLWILTSRYGHCGEFSLIFRDMAYAANLTVRRARCYGEDHEWNEVLIDDAWIIVDATAVDLPHGNGYDLPTDFMEVKAKGNVSYVEAEYINGKTDDITFRYTNLTSINILATDSDGRPIPDVTVKLKSNNRYEAKDTKLSKKTNETGQCTFTIGGGDYIFESTTGGFIPMTNKTSSIFAENNSYDLQIVLRTDWTYVFIATASACIIILISIIFYFRKRKMINNR
jgi:hypothetical protein